MNQKIIFGTRTALELLNKHVVVVGENERDRKKIILLHSERREQEIAIK